MRSFAVVAVLCTGCTVEVGRGEIAPLSFDLPIKAAAMPPPIGSTVHVEFLSAADAASLDDQYGSKLGAIKAIDVEIDEIVLLDAFNDAIDGSSFSVQLGAVIIDHAGQRVRLPDDIEKQVIAAIRQHASVTLTVRLEADWPEATDPVVAHTLMQLVVIVDALRAL
jgi:hypothetical protein